MITRNLKVILPTKKPLSLDAIKKHDKAKSAGLAVLAILAAITFPALLAMWAFERLKRNHEAEFGKY